MTEMNLIAVLGAGSPRSWCQRGLFLAKPLSSACRQLSCCGPTWPFLSGHALLVSLVFFQDTNLTGVEPHPLTSFNFNYFLLDDVSNHSHTGG